MIITLWNVSCYKYVFSHITIYVVFCKFITRYQYTVVHAFLIRLFPQLCFALIVSHRSCSSRSTGIMFARIRCWRLFDAGRKVVLQRLFRRMPATHVLFLRWQRKPIRNRKPVWNCVQANCVSASDVSLDVSVWICERRQRMRSVPLCQSVRGTIDTVESISN